jgi:hypothetical protein
VAGNIQNGRIKFFVKGLRKRFSDPFETWSRRNILERYYDYGVAGCLECGLGVDGAR